MNIDIVTIHHRILKILLHENVKYTEDNEKILNEIKENYNEVKSKLSYSIIKNLQNKIEIKEQEINEMTDYTLLHYYILFSTPLIEKYKKICQTPIKINLCNHTKR